jgi:hypothetical protein
MENNNLSILADQHTTIAFLATPMSPFVVIGIFPASFHHYRHTPPHRHRQLSISAIGTAQQPPPDSATSSPYCPIINNVGYRQSFYRADTSLL